MWMFPGIWGPFSPHWTCSPLKSSTTAMIYSTQGTQVSSHCVCLPAKQHCLDFPCASQTQHVQTQNPHPPPQNLLVLLFSLFLLMIPPACQLLKPETGCLHSLLPFSPTLHQFGQEASQFSCTEISPSTLVPLLQPWLAPLTFLPGITEIVS